MLPTGRDCQSLSDQVAIVTGASRGIGRAIAVGLAREGAITCLVGRHPEALEEISRAELPGSRMLSYPADLTVETAVSKLAQNLARDFGRVDILVHCAGVFSMGQIENAPIGEFDRQYYVNVRAPYLLTQFLLPLMKSCHGQIVFVNSTAGVSARENVGQYAATKHALKAVADSLRSEVNGAGVRVLSVFLGRTATPMQAAIHEMEDRPYKPENLIQPEEVCSVVINSLSLPRTAEVTEIYMRPLLKTY